jgi:hypothetical protein
MEAHHNVMNKSGGGKIAANAMDMSIIPNAGKNAFIRSQKQMN